MSKQSSKYTVCKWFNKNTKAINYGIDAKVGSKWYHVLDDDGPIFFDAKKEAENRVRELNKEIEQLTP